MAKRSNRQQTKHDKTVLDTARYYEGSGYKVEADISGYDQPSTINHRRPDVTAKKKGDTVIVEVETNESMKTDEAQHNAFKKAAEESGIRFRIKKAK